MEKPSFDEVSVDSSSPDSSSGGSSSRQRGDRHLHIKGKYGTTTFQSGDGCMKCDRNASHVVVGRGVDDKGNLFDAVNSCERHKDVIAQSLENEHDCMIVVREY